MIADLDDYIEAHISPQPEYLYQIDRDTNLRFLNGRMCSGHIQGAILKMLVAMSSPKRILELGTFTGYSALCMAEALHDDATIDTIEADDELEETILMNINNSANGKKIRLHIGDALHVVEKFGKEEFDFVLIDADKRQYSKYFEKIFPLVKPGAFIVADNTLWDGHVTEAIPHSSQTVGIMEFNDLIASWPGIEVAILPVRDGLTLIRKL